MKQYSNLLLLLLFLLLLDSLSHAGSGPHSLVWRDRACINCVSCFINRTGSQVEHGIAVVMPKKGRKLRPWRCEECDLELKKEFTWCGGCSKSKAEVVEANNKMKQAADSQQAASKTKADTDKQEKKDRKTKSGAVAPSNSAQPSPQSSSATSHVISPSAPSDVSSPVSPAAQVSCPEMIQLRKQERYHKAALDALIGDDELSDHRPFSSQSSAADQAWYQVSSACQAASW